jgi:hypothetical protein
MCEWCYNESEYAETENTRDYNAGKYHPSCYEGLMS